MATTKPADPASRANTASRSEPLTASRKATAAEEALIVSTPANRDVRQLAPRQPILTRALDISGALGMIVALLPFLLLLAMVTTVTTAGSPIFAHSRVGKGGKMFKCYKFRTMYIGAEERLAKVLASDPELRRQWDAEHKLRDDPRITPFGRFMRVTSLDELPQLFNVLKGEMGLVGPRPIVEAELARYGKYTGSYLTMKPGLTGLWQVTGRSGTTYRRRVATDHVYALNKCLFLDLRIIFATIPAVLLQKGAY